MAGLDRLLHLRDINGFDLVFENAYIMEALLMCVNKFIRGLRAEPLCFHLLKLLLESHPVLV